jgi:hypothetical protein
LFSRLQSHTRNHLAHRWQYFSWFGLVSVNKVGSVLSAWNDPAKKVSGTIKSTLNEIEGAIIAATEPTLNKQGATFTGSERYRQVQDQLTKVVTTKEIDKSIRHVEAKMDKILTTLKSNKNL